MNDWRIFFTTIPGRRPRIAVAILLTVMFALVFAQKFVPNITLAWIPVALLLLLLFQKLRWLTREPSEVRPSADPTPEISDRPRLPDNVVKIITAISGMIVLAIIYILYRTMSSIEDAAVVAVFVLGPIVALVLWLNFRRRSE